VIDGWRRDGGDHALFCIKLVLVASLESMDAIMKQSGPEVPYSNDFLGGGYT
jgi:hypothetical protein